MKRILLISLLVLATLSIKAQTIGENPSFKDRIFTGGSFGMSFGTFTFVNVSPVIGYMITQRLSAGVGVLYQYVQDKRFSPPLERNDYGGSIFTRFTIMPPVFLHAEYEYLNYEFGDSRLGFNSFMAGGGIAQPISRNASFIATALYNFSYQPNSPGVVQPYNSPWVIRVGITAGF